MLYDISMNISVRAICVKDGKLFCVKNTAYITGKPSEFWCVPGGGVDDNEDLVTALKREIKEELGIEAKVGNLLYIQEYFDKRTQKIYLEFFYHVTNTDDFTDIDLTKTTHGVEEIAEFGFIDASKEFVLPKFLNTESFNSLSGQTVKKFDYLN
jgi:8-oxo-dGTP pyrophosphatase MutT (NUDIX family)